MMKYLFFGCLFGYSFVVSGQEPQDFFIDGLAPKQAEIPPEVDVEKTDDVPDVRVTMDAAATIATVSPFLYGNNANIWMTKMVDQPPLVKHITALSPNVIRFPGGNLSSVYFWDRAPGDPPDDAPTELLNSDGEEIDPGYWYGLNEGSWTATVDDYYGLLAETGNTGIITVNYGYARYSTADDPVASAAHHAAEWVRYDNGRTKFWEVGNESNGTWQAGFRIDVSNNSDGQPAIINGTLYGEHFKVFADSMRKAAQEIGATIYIGAQLLQEPPANWWNNTDRFWNEGVFDGAGNTPDYYVIHSYYTPYQTNSSAAEVLESATEVTDAMMAYVTNQMTNAGVELKPVALTEWNIFAEGSKQQASYINGMHAAIVLGALAKNKYGLACRWDLANGWADGNDHGLFSQGDEPGDVPKWNPRAAFYYMYYFQKFFGDTMIAAEVPEDEIIAYASLFASGEAGIVLINKGTGSHVAALDLQNFGYGDKFRTYTLIGGTDNGEFSLKVKVNDKAATYATGGPVSYETIPANASVVGGGVRVQLPARSVVYVMVDDGDNELVKATGIQIDASSSEISTPGGTLQLAAVITPDEASETVVNWSIVEGSSAATISSEGVLTAVANGTVKVRATAIDGSGVFGEYTVTLTNQVVTGWDEGGVNDIQVFPNPTSGTVLIRHAESISMVSLSSDDGREILNVANGDRHNELEIPLPPGNGTLLLNIFSRNGGRTVRKIIVR